MNLLYLLYILLGALFIVLSVRAACRVVCHEVSVEIPTFTGIVHFLSPDEKLVCQQHNLTVSDILRNPRVNGPPAHLEALLWHR